MIPGASSHQSAGRRAPAASLETPSRRDGLQTGGLQRKTVLSSRHPGQNFLRGKNKAGKVSFSFKKGEPAGAAIRRVVREQLDGAVAGVADPGMDAAEAVHQVRVRCKRIRATLRLIRPNARGLYRAENAAFREMAADLSLLRDVHVMHQTLDSLERRSKAKNAGDRFEPIRSLLGERPEDTGRENPEFKAKAGRFFERAREARERIATWEIDGSGFESLADGFRKSYKRGSKAMRAAYRERGDSQFHEWRKRVKDLGYQVELFQDVWPAFLKPLHRKLTKLGNLLGKRNDLRVLLTRVLENSGDSNPKGKLKAFVARVERRKRKLETDAEKIGRRVYAERAKALVRRLGAHWDQEF